MPRGHSKILNASRIAGKGLFVAGVVATGVDVALDINKGNYYSAGARASFAIIAGGCAFIPVVGWGVALSIGIADYVWGDQFYNWVEQ